jgi:putative restriction endonuclease
MGMGRGYIGLTDPDWYQFLSKQPHVDEVNFWQPHAGQAFRALKPNEPFIFKLRAPYKAIAGFGFYARYETLPAWLAWECFEEMNGAPDRDTMIDQIVRLRNDDSPAIRAGNFSIGSIMIAAPVFFPPSEWVTPPLDWAKTGIQKGKSYPLDSGEGRRIIKECYDKAFAGNRYWNIQHPRDGIGDESARYGSPTTIRPRLGQGLFSLAVRDAYDGACAVTHEHSAPVLEAAHIKPYACGGEHDVNNGLLLRRDLHRLFDRGYVTVTPDYRFRVGNSLRDEFNNGRSYYGMDGSLIAIPEQIQLQPARELLDWHGEEVFRG